MEKIKTEIHEDKNRDTYTHTHTHTHTDTWECHLMTPANRVIQIQVKEQIPRIDSQHQKLRIGKEGFYLVFQRKQVSADTLILRPLASRSIRIFLLLFYVTQFVKLYYSSTRKLVEMSSKITMYSPLFYCSQRENKG